MSSNPLWWRIVFWIAVGILSLAAAVFLWALAWPVKSEHWQWTQLGAAIVSALTGFLMIAILGGLLIYRWIKERATRSSAGSGS